MRGRGGEGSCARNRAEKEAQQQLFSTALLHYKNKESIPWLDLGVLRQVMGDIPDNWCRKTMGMLCVPVHAA